MVTKRKMLAEEAVLKVASEFVNREFQVFFPLSESGPIDLVIYKNKQFKRVQVKTTKPNTKGQLIIKLESTNNWQNKKYTSEDVDFVVAYDYKNKQYYLITMKEFEGRARVHLRMTPAKNNQQKGINIASNYVWV